MAYEVNIEHRTAKVDVLNRNGNKILLDIDGHKYDVDIVMVEQGVYSILYNGHSYNVELIEGDGSKKYIVNTFAKTFNVEIVDAESKYINSRNKGLKPEEENLVASPMPGKVVRIPVRAGDKVTAGQTLVVVEAMKMQNEIKSPKCGTLERFLAKEGQTVNAGDVLAWVE